MQKQSLQNLPIIYRPYDFPASFPVLAFLGGNWRNDLSVPPYLHFHNGIEIGRCLAGAGKLLCPYEIPYQQGDYSIIFPQTPHMSVT